MFLQRNLQKTLLAMANQFKAVAVTGPRQSGKTTLCREQFPRLPYVSLENPDERGRAERDPRGFLRRFPDGCILDEVQRVPDLFSYLQEVLDAERRPGRYILTGSQQFGVMANISQSLAGRVGLLALLPFSASELHSAQCLPDSWTEALFRGGYPPLYDQGIDPGFWLNAYIATYVERDVRQIVNIQDASLFQRFLGLSAGNIGQLFNASRIGNDCGLNHGTVTKWFSILESSYIAFRLTPHHSNFRKRLVKTPKLYFWDTGLAIQLLGIEDPAQLQTHPLRGALFENWVIVELMKLRLNLGKRPNLYFWRNNTGLEVDVLADYAGRLLPVEIKSGETLSPDWLTAMRRWTDLAGDAAMEPCLFYGGEIESKEAEVHILPWRRLATPESLPGALGTRQ
ncbi:MAG: ATP-binding protein [Verrucomicrobiota bacterium]